MISSWQSLCVDLGLPRMKGIYTYTQYSQNNYVYVSCPSSKIARLYASRDE